MDVALAQAGNLEGKVVIDATNQYGPDGLANLAVSVADHNQKRLPRAHLIRAFNMLTASDQAAVAEGRHSPAAMFYAAEDDRAKEIAEQLIPSTSFTPVYLGGWNNVSHIEAPDFLLGRLYTVERAQKIASLIQSHKLDAAKALAQQDQWAIFS